MDSQLVYKAGVDEVSEIIGYCIGEEITLFSEECLANIKASENQEEYALSLIPEQTKDE
jgi:hypothetical protein